MKWLKSIKIFSTKYFQKAPLEPPGDGTKPWVKAKKAEPVKATSGTKETGTTRVLKHISYIKETKWIFQVVTGIDRGREYIGFTKEIRIGRHPENLILLRDPKISRFHALLYLKGTKLFIEDLGSTNGTKVNGTKISKKTQLFPGDQIKLGETVIQVTLEK